MENLIVEGSHGVYFVPYVNFNAETGECELAGESYLEDTVLFYNPLLQWLENYINKTREAIKFNIKLTYFNTSSSRCLLDILNMLKDYEDEGGEVAVNWYYDEEDIDMQEEIEDYEIDTGLHIHLIPSTDLVKHDDSEQDEED